MTMEWPRIHQVVADTWPSQKMKGIKATQRPAGALKAPAKAVMQVHHAIACLAFDLEASVEVVEEAMNQPSGKERTPQACLKFEIQS